MNFKSKFFTLFAVFAITALVAQEAQNQYLANRLSEERERITQKEREALKQKIKEVNARFSNEEITSVVADSLKLEYAEETAKKIEEKYLEREAELYQNLKSEESQLNTSEKETYVNSRNNISEYPFHVNNDLVLAFGLNSLMDDYEPFQEDYEFTKSLFLELGWSWKTNLIPYRDFLNLRYGISYQINSFSPKKDQFFYTDEDDIVTLGERASDIDGDKSIKLIYTNLVLPIHLEFGSKRYRYVRTLNNGNTSFSRFNRNAFIFGVGVYGGFNLNDIQRVRYFDRKDELYENLNLSNFVYGFSGYVSIPYLMTLYAKIDRSPLFKNQPESLYNVSLGIRFGIN